MDSMITSAAFAAALISTATDFVGLVETRENAAWEDPTTIASEKAKSDLLRQTMALFGWEPGEPYCAAFDAAVVYLTAQRLGLNPVKFVALWTPHCMTNVRLFAKLGKLDDQPSIGALMLMRHGKTDSGHAGITADISGAFPNRMLANIEGNTSGTVKGDQRQGDGIYLKARNVFSNGDLKTQGWVSAATILSFMS